MKRYIIVLVLICFTSCQTTKIKERTYKISSATTEIGSVGLSKSLYIDNDYHTKVFPNLENKIRVDISIVPFTKKLNKVYLEKGKYNQSQAKIQFVDSLALKPELVVMSILDISGYANEINSENNKSTFKYLKDTKKAKIVTSIATTLSSENIAKIRLADSYYLTNNQEKKYTLSLYKANKKTETIDLQSGVVLAYELSKCCWSVDSKGKWYLADIIKDCNSCKGDTSSKVKEKKHIRSLYKM